MTEDDIPVAARPRLRAQALTLAAGRGGAAAVSAVVFVVAAHYLSVPDFGLLALLLSLGLLTSVVGDLGLSSVLAEEVAVDPRTARSAAVRVITQRIPLSIVAATCTAVMYATAGGAWALAALFAISTLATAVYSTFTAAFRALGRPLLDAGNEVVSRGFVLAVGWVALAADGGLTAILAVYVVADVGSAAILGVLFLRATRGAAVRIESERVSLRRARSLAATGIVTTAYQRIDVWLLGLFKAPANVAAYAAAYRCFDALLLPAIALAQLSIPHTAGQGEDELRRRLTRLGTAAFLVTAPLALVTLLAAEPIVTMLFGDAFESAVDPLRILAVGALVTAPIYATVSPLAIRSTRVPRALAVALASNVLVNLVMIPSYGATGAAAATLSCDVGLLIWLGREIARLGGDQREDGAASNPRPASRRPMPTQNPVP